LDECQTRWRNNIERWTPYNYVVDIHLVLLTGMIASRFMTKMVNILGNDKKGFGSNIS
jgi:hypothetical protein